MCTEHVKFSVPRWEYPADETEGSTTAINREDSSTGDYRELNHLNSFELVS